MYLDLLPTNALDEDPDRHLNQILPNHVRAHMLEIRLAMQGPLGAHYTLVLQLLQFRASNAHLVKNLVRMLSQQRRSPSNRCPIHTELHRRA
jgi:hypothetical protein